MKIHKFVLVAAAFLVSTNAFAIAPVSGFWDGMATYVNSNPAYDHQTHLYISCTANYGTAAYTYVNLPGTPVCNSTLALQSVINGVYTYADTTQSQGCDNGIVKVKKLTTFPFNGMLWFQWLTTGGVLQNEGYLSRTAGVICLP